MPTILIVEDESAVRSIARRVLEREGFTVLEAASGAEALEVSAAASAIALVLSDVVMPDMTGAELCDALVGVRPDLPVLFMSGYALEDIRDRVVCERGAGFLAKPFTPGGLAGAVRDVLQLPAA